jgi:hypothetical protein
MNNPDAPAATPPREPATTGFTVITTPIQPAVNSTFDSVVPVVWRRSPGRQDLWFSLFFRRVAYAFASKGTPPGGREVGADNGAVRAPVVAVVVARSDVQHPRRVPLGGLTRCLVFRGAFAPPSTNTQASWRICGFVGWSWTGRTSVCRPKQPPQLELTRTGSRMVVRPVKGGSATSSLMILPLGSMDGNRLPLIARSRV